MATIQACPIAVAETVPGMLRTRTTTLGTLTSRCASRTLGLYVSLGFVLQCTCAQAELTGLRINLKKFDRNLVTLLDAGLLHRHVALPVDLTDMQQTFLTRNKLYKAALWHQALNGSLIYLTDLWKSNDSFDLGDSSIHRLFVG